MPKVEERSQPRTVRRYGELELGDAIFRPCDYSSACQELALILRLAYAKLHKNAQSLVLLDTLSAFRLLLEVQSSNCISAANHLVLAAEVALPKQKKALASSEFKRSMVKLKRRDKAQQLEGYFAGSLHLPLDVILYIFRFLDMRSLVNASSVCWAWNAASKDNLLWMSQYSQLFGKTELSCQIKSQFGDPVMLKNGKIQPENFDWHGAFKRKFIGNSAWKSRPYRAFCKHCKSIIWLSTLTCETPHCCPASEDNGSKIRPISSYMIVEYLLGECEDVDGNNTCNYGLSSSDSDDSDDGCQASHWKLPKLLALPRLNGN
ncbi:F-box protein [Apostasia shenzhenica]|uniref:F-box protein n=1 Tax=Apostasia shenzhenica TaxID=1088818 RepID=A0A2I0A0D4_9ASPA|nr:F-box protein [Apostasia shenzhenica]